MFSTIVGVTEKKTHSSSLELDEAERVRATSSAAGLEHAGASRAEAAPQAEDRLVARFEARRCAQGHPAEERAGGRCASARAPLRQRPQPPLPAKPAVAAAPPACRDRRLTPQLQRQCTAASAPEAAKPAPRRIVPQPRQAAPIVTAPPQTPAIAAKPPAGPVVAKPPAGAPSLRQLRTADRARPSPPRRRQVP